MLSDMYCSNAKLCCNHDTERKLLNGVGHAKKAIVKVKHQIAQEDVRMKDTEKIRRLTQSSEWGRLDERMKLQNISTRGL